MKTEAISRNQGAYRSGSPTSRRNQVQSDAIRERTGQDHPRAAVTARPDAALASLPRQSQLRPQRERDRGPSETPQVCDETHVRGQFRRGGVPNEGGNQTHSDAISLGEAYLMREAIRRTQMQSP